MAFGEKRGPHEVIPIRRIRLVDEATRIVRDAILKEKLTPGTRLRQAELANQLGISRTPLREALMKLEQEGLIARLPQGGLTVIALKFEEAIELYEIREMLDGLAAALTARRGDEKTLGVVEGHLKKMEKCVQKQNAHEWFVHHVGFHEAIMEACGNSRLLNFITNVRLSIQRFHPILLTTPDRLNKAFQEHVAIFKAIKAGDAKAAERLARLHIVNAREIVIGLSTEPESSMETGQRL
ncbi:MAG: GntR family transcriptional regulator [Candidatus Binatia bacterium]